MNDVRNVNGGTIQNWSENIKWGLDNAHEFISAKHSPGNVLYPRRGGGGRPGRDRRAYWAQNNKDGNHAGGGRVILESAKAQGSIAVWDSTRCTQSDILNEIDAYQGIYGPTGRSTPLTRTTARRMYARPTATINSGTTKTHYYGGLY